MRKLFIVYCIIIVVFILLFTVDSKAESIITEEASPIREEDKIIGFDYYINISNDPKNNISINTLILSSINHYKDIKLIDDFLIDLRINKNYNLKRLYMICDNSIIKRINYKKKNKIFTFNLKREDFKFYKDNCFIKIELEK
jgi:hypothetical protein